VPIISSTFELDSGAQIDGRRYCREFHTDHLGAVHRFEYLSGNINNAQVLADRAVRLVENLKERELAYAVYDAAWNYSLQWATNTDLSAWVRERYKNAAKDDLARIAKRILEWITNGRFTDAQVRGAFGLTSGQWTTLKTKMESLVASYDVVQTAVGE